MIEIWFRPGLPDGTHILRPKIPIWVHSEGLGMETGYIFIENRYFLRPFWYIISDFGL
jgi:hypothetical protein